MEVEQATSQFHARPSVGVVAAAERKAWPRHFRFRAPNEAEHKFQKIFSQLYLWLDALSGQKSRAFVAREDAYGPFADILNFLRSKGITGEVLFGPHRYNDAPAFIRCDLNPDFPKNSTDGTTTNYRGIGHGFGRDVEIVLSKMLGEFFERYFLMLYRRRDFLRSSYAALKRKNLPALDPAALAGFSEVQKKARPRCAFDQDSIFYWQKCRRALGGEEVLVPAQLVHWNYDFRHDEQEPILGEGNTNGAGGYFTEKGALLSGLYERIQRDAFLIYWLNGITPPRILPESVPDEDFQNLLNETKRYGYDVCCLDTTLDTGVPSFAVAVIDASGKSPYFSLGAGCQADPAKALSRALEEAWSVHYWMRRQEPYSLPEPYKPFSDSSVGQGERLRLAANKDAAPFYKFLIEGQEHDFRAINFDYPRRFSSEKEEFEFLAKRVESLGPGYEVLYFLAAHPVLKELGYHSARVIVPQMVPLYLREISAPLGAERLKRVPEKLDLESEREFCAIPHPFP